MSSKQVAAASRLSKTFRALDPGERLKKACAEIAGRIVFTTSFGIEDQLLAHEIFSRDLPIEVVTLDTGRLFPETYQVWSETEERYGKKIRAFFPDRDGVEDYIASEGINGFRGSAASRRACCFVRKVEPLGRALKGASGWITGLRADQSQERSHADFVSYEEVHGLIKLNPILDWTREKIANAVRANQVPYNPLHDRGFLSIGCAPCTRAIAPGEPERAGRWWWEQEDKKECGLHTPEAAQKRELARKQNIFPQIQTSA
jgi:phosphoadenosine phosphosulfate reductase